MCGGRKKQPGISVPDPSRLFLADRLKGREFVLDWEAIRSSL